MPGTITTDLTTYDAADAATNWVSIGTFATAPVANTDMNIQGTNALVGRVSAASAWYHASNAGLDLTTGNHVFIWLKNVTWPGTDTKANGGLRVCLSSDATPTLTGTSPSNGPTNSKSWYVDGTDTETVAGWICYVVDPVSTPDLTLGTPVMTSIKRIGYGSKILSTIGAGSFKPSNLLVDVVRYGTGLTINNGTSGAPVAFTDIFATDSNTTNSYGVITSFAGSYFLAGKLTFGTTSQSAITYFKDTNETVAYLSFPVAKNFYEIIVQGAASFTTTFQLGTFASSVASGGCSIEGSGTSCWTLTSSNANAITKLYASTFGRMRRATLNSASEIRSCTFVSCGDITTNSCVLDSCIFQSQQIAAPISAEWQLRIANSTEMANITNCQFIDCNKAIKLASTGTYTFSNIKFSGNVYDVENAVSLCDFYPENNQNSVTSLQTTATFGGVGQSFTGNGKVVQTVSWYLKKTGSPTGTATANIYAHSGTFGTSSIPTGAALATSQTFTVSNLTTSYQLITFRFLGSSSITLTNGTNYVVTIEYSSGSSGNTVDVGSDNPHPTASGNGSTLTTTTWTASSTTDYPFYVFTPTASDKYNESNQDTTQSLVSGSVIGNGQSFVGNGGVLTSAQFYLKKTGSPTGTAVAKVYAHSGTFGTSSIPTGTALATSATLDVTTLTTSYQLIAFKFIGTNNITLTNATDYVITIEYSGGSSGNTVDVGIDSSSPTHSGNESTLTGSTWTAHSGIDTIFFVYTDGQITVNVTNAGSTPTVLNNIGCSTTVNNAVTLKVVVLDTSGNPIQNARVAIYASNDITQADDIVNALTDATGTVSSSYAYISDTAIDIRVRKNSTGTTRYVNNDSSGTIVSTGFSSTVVLIQDTIASP